MSAGARAASGSAGMADAASRCRRPAAPWADAAGSSGVQPAVRSTGGRIRPSSAPGSRAQRPASPTRAPGSDVDHPRPRLEAAPGIGGTADRLRSEKRAPCTIMDRDDKPYFLIPFDVERARQVLPRPEPPRDLFGIASARAASLARRRTRARIRTMKSVLQLNGKNVICGPSNEQALGIPLRRPGSC